MVEPQPHQQEAATRNHSRTSSSERRRRDASQVQPVALGAGLAVGTILPTSTTLRSKAPPSTIHERKSHLEEKSNKQGPGQRKVRRWNNDNFVGISSEVPSHIATLYAEADMIKGRYVMPNYPLEYRSVFDDMVRNGGEGEGGETKTGDGRKGVGSGVVDWTKVRERFVSGDVVVQSSEPMVSEAAMERRRIRERELFKSGQSMMEQVQGRLFRVVQQACDTSPWNQSVLNAFEEFLVIHMGDGSAEERGTSPRSSIGGDSSTQILKELLVQTPFVTRKAGNQITVRFVFDDAEKKGAFHRLLLHAVCQFHGLTIASSTTAKGHKMMTVTGTCKGCQFKFLEFCLVEETLEVANSESFLNSMATLKVT